MLTRSPTVKAVGRLPMGTLVHCPALYMCRIAKGMLPCPPSSRASHVMKSGVQSLCADTLRCPQSPCPVHHTLWVGVPHRPRITFSPFSLRFPQSPSPVHHTLWVGVSASAARAHFSAICMRAILASRFLMIVSRLAGTSAAIRLRTGLDDLVFLHAAKL